MRSLVLSLQMSPSSATVGGRNLAALSKGARCAIECIKITISLGGTSIIAGLFILFLSYDNKDSYGHDRPSTTYARFLSL